MRIALKLHVPELVRIIGEATFHQIRGRLTTRQLPQTISTLKAATAKYFKLH